MRAAPAAHAPVRRERGAEAGGPDAPCWETSSSGSVKAEILRSVPEALSESDPVLRNHCGSSLCVSQGA